MKTMTKTAGKTATSKSVANAKAGNIINKKLLAASRIFQLLLDEDSSNAKCLALSDAEVVELVAKEN